MGQMNVAFAVAAITNRLVARTPRRRHVSATNDWKFCTKGNCTFVSLSIMLDQIDT